MSILLSEVASRKPQPGSRITCLSLHPTEPLVAVGLSSGELCIYVSRTDGMTALLEIQEGLSALSSTLSSAKVPPPPDPAKVLRVDAEGFALRHCLFLGGREDDLVRDVVQPLVASAGGLAMVPRPASPSSSPSAPAAAAGTTGASSSDSLKAMARHLLLCITETNSVYLLDIDSSALLLHWDCGNCGVARDARRSGLQATPRIHPDSPFAAHRVIVHAACFGALLFVTCTDRPVTGAAGAAGVSAPVTGADKKFYVCHLARTNPFMAPTTSPHLQAGLSASSGATSGKVKLLGPYVVSLRSGCYKHIKHKHEQKLLKRQKGIRFLSVHPFAPIVLVGTAQCVYVFTNMRESGGHLTPYAIVATREALRESEHGSSVNSRSVGSATSPSSLVPDATSIVDACFLPTRVVLDAQDGVAHNVQLALLTPYRASVLDLSYAPGNGILDEQAFCTPIALVRRHRVSASTNAPPRAPVFYHRLYTWTGSPASLFVEQSDGTALEYSRNDAVAPLTRVLTVRSRLQRAQLVLSASSPATATSPSHGRQQREQLSQRRIALEASGRVPRISSTLPLWGVLDSFPTDPRTLCANPTVNAHGERRVVFSQPTGRSSLYAAVAAEGGDGSSSDAVVESLMASTDTVDCSAVGFTAILSGSGSTGTSTGAAAATTTSPRGVAVGALLLDVPVRLLRMEHGYYFIGGRAQAVDVMFVAGLTYTMEDLDSEARTPYPRTEAAASSTSAGAATGGGIYTQRGECRRPVVRAALVCVPARESKVRALHHSSGISGSGFSHAHITHVPVPDVSSTTVNPSSLPAASAIASPSLLSVSFQLSNDETTPCVWSLWSTASTGTATATAPSPTTASASPTRTVLTFQSYFVSADAAEVVWHNHGTPEVVVMDDPVYQSPSQVFAQAAVGGPRGTWALEPPTMGQLFLYYEESHVLVLGTVVRGSPFVVGSAYGMGVDGGTKRDNTLRFCTQATLQITPWAQRDARRRQRHQRHPSKADSATRYHTGAIKLTATLSGDGNTLLVAAASRRHGFAVMQFPVLGRGDASEATVVGTAPADSSFDMKAPSEEAMMAAVLGSGGRRGRRSGAVTTLTREKLLFSRRWAQIDMVRAVDPAEGADSSSSSEEGDDDDDNDDEEGVESASEASISPSQPAADDQEGASGRLAVEGKLARPRARAACPGPPLVKVRTLYKYAPVNLLEWMFLGAGSTGSSRGHVPAARSAAALDRDRAEAALLASFDTGVVPFLVLQRHRKLYVVHLSGGTVVPLCPAITSSIPIGVAYQLHRVPSDREGSQGTHWSSSRVPSSAQVSGATGAGAQADFIAPSEQSGRKDTGTRSGSSSSSEASDDASEGDGQGNGRSQQASGGHPNQSSSVSRGGGGGDDKLTVRVHLVYGDYLGAIAQAFRGRQAAQQLEVYDAVDALSTQQARTNTAASVYWLLGATGIKKKHPMARGSSGNAEARRVTAGTPGAGKAAELAKVRARLLGLQSMQKRVTQERDGSIGRSSSGSATEHAQASSSTTRAAVAAAAAVGELTYTSHGTVFHMDVTETLSTAVLKMQGMIISQAITDLVSSSVLFSQFIRDTFDAFARHVQTSVVYGNAQTAEIIAAVPLASVTYCLSHEMRLLVAQQKNDFARWETGQASSPGAATRSAAGGAGRGAGGRGASLTDLLVAQRTRRQWWMLVMRSHCIVSRLNPSEQEESWLAVQQTLQAAPEPLYPIKRNVAGGSSSEYSAESLAELLLYCPTSEHPSSLWSTPANLRQTPIDEDTADAPAAGATTPCTRTLFTKAFFHALGLLGASTTLLDKQSKKLMTKPPQQRQRQAYVSALADVIKTIPVDGGHWLSAVYVCQLVENLHAIAEQTGDDRGSEPHSRNSSDKKEGNGDAAQDEETKDSPVAGVPQLAALFAQELETEGNQLAAMESVVEVAASTVAAMRGMPYHSRRRSNTNAEPDEADAQSTSMSTVTGTAAGGAGGEGTSAADEQRRRVMNAAIAESVSTRMRVLQRDPEDADAAALADEAQAAAAWHQLEAHGLPPITASRLRRDSNAPTTAVTSAEGGSGPTGAIDAANQVHGRQQKRVAAATRDGQQQQHSKHATASLGDDRGEVEEVAQREEYFEKGVGLLARLDQLRAEVYAAHWRALYDPIAYPSRFLFPAPHDRKDSDTRTAASPHGRKTFVNGYPLSQLPQQVWPTTATPHPGGPRVPATKASPSPPHDAPLTDKPAAAPPSQPLPQQQQQQQQAPISVSRRVTPLEAQMAAVRDEYAFQSVTSRRVDPAAGTAAAAAAAAAGSAADVFDLPQIRFEESVTNRPPQPSPPQRLLDDGDYKNRLAGNRDE